MADIAVVSGAFQSLKAAFEIGKAILDLNVSAQIQTRVMDMNAKILAAQQETIASNDYQTTLRKRISDLEKQVADFEAWNAEAETYKLTDLRSDNDPRGSVLAFAPKEGTHSGEPAHLLCAECFNSQHKSILQHQVMGFRQPVLLCPHCDNVLFLEGTNPGTTKRKSR
jgi:hypothetical protein